MDSLQNLKDKQLSRKLLSSIEPSLHLIGDNLDLKTLSQSSGQASSYPLQLDVSSCKGDKQNDVTTANVNGMELLNSKLKETEDELHCKTIAVSELERKMEELRQIISSNGISKSATQKIIELSRKNRDLHSELAKEKTRGRQLHKQVLKLTEENATHKTEVLPVVDTISQEQLLRDKVATLEDQLAISKRKVAEQSNQCQKLKQDLKLAQRILTQEVGEDVSISNITTSMGGWRGRAQQILSLQNKISELQRQAGSVGKGKQSQRPQSSANSIASNQSTTKQQRLDDVHRASVHKIEKENKQRYQDLKIELDKLHEDHEALKQQCSALRARNKTLTQECKERRKEAKEKSLNRNSSKTDSTLNGYEDLEKIITNLKLRLNTSEDEKAKLRDTIGKLQSQGLTKQKALPQYQNSSDNGCGVSLPPIKLKSDRKPHPQLHSSLAATRCSLSAGQPSSITTAHKQFLGINYEEVCAKYRVLEIERDRLVGLTDFLQKRLDEGDEKIIKLQGELNIAQQAIKNNKDNGVIRNGKLHEGQTMDELKESLLLQKDENEVLRDNLLMVRRQRQEERKSFHSTLEETKQIFMETIRNIESRH